MNNNPSDTARILRRAADVIEDNGWIQYDFLSTEDLFVRRLPAEQCRVCVRGAINIAAGHDPRGIDELKIDARKDIVDALALHLGFMPGNDDQITAGMYVSLWNDHGLQTAEKVVTGLRAAAETAEAAR